MSLNQNAILHFAIEMEAGLIDLGAREDYIISTYGNVVSS
jgi:hypothetical protein